MQVKTPLQQALVIIGILGIAFSAIISLRQILYTKPVASPGNQIQQNLEQVSPGLPTHLKIPRINVDAAIEHVGLTPQGVMDAPNGPINVAWFNLGPRPGENGSAVIAGHEGWKNGTQAVFDDLHTIQKGDVVYVEDENGTNSTFVVRELRTYGKNEDVSGIFDSNDGVAHLNLITCEGVWDKARKSYPNRLVVFADKKVTQ